MCKLVSWKEPGSVNFLEVWQRIYKTSISWCINLKNDSISKGCLPLKLTCHWTKKPFKISPEFRAFWVLIRPLLSHGFPPLKKYCLLYLLEASPPTDDCTLQHTQKRFSALHSTSTWSPVMSMLQNICLVLSSPLFLNPWSHSSYFSWITLSRAYFGVCF